jgi:formylmethanofuran dehydrogenase subunit E
MKSLPENLLRKAVEFHGHLGPYMVLGLRVGWLAKRRLQAGPFEMWAVVGCPARPPGSCFLDGVQVGSGCTVGKANLRRKPCADLWASFRAPEGDLTITVTAEGIKHVGDAFANRQDVESLCMQIASGTLDDVFLAEDGP